jgi:hypothetical protein
MLNRLGAFCGVRTSDARRSRITPITGSRTISAQRPPFLSSTSSYQAHGGERDDAEYHSHYERRPVKEHGGADAHQQTRQLIPSHFIGAQGMCPAPALKCLLEVDGFHAGADEQRRKQRIERRHDQDDAADHGEGAMGEILSEASQHSRIASCTRTGNRGAAGPAVTAV